MLRLHKFEMSKYFIVLVFNFCFISSAFSLQCQVTDIDDLQYAREVNHLTKECDLYIKAVTKRFSLGTIGENTTLRCYTVNVKTDKRETNFEVKGCVPAGHCEIMVKPIIAAEAKKHGVRVKDMKCVECIGDGCNSAVGM